METYANYHINRPPDPENKKGEKIFENEILEHLAMTSPTYGFIAYVPLMLGIIYYSVSKNFVSSLPLQVGLWATGLFFWTFAEYITHRFFYHIVIKVKIIKRVQYLFHGWHHKHPGDPKHLFMPALAGWGIILAVGTVFYLVMGQYSFLFLSGFIGGYLSYVFLHYCIHRYTPPFKWMNPWWRHHLSHHYRNPKHAYAVQVLFWDKLFKTMPPPFAPHEESELLKHG